MTPTHWRVATLRKTRVLFSVSSMLKELLCRKRHFISLIGADWWDSLGRGGGLFWPCFAELMNLPCTNILLFYMLPGVKGHHRQGMTNHCINQDLKAFCHQHSRIQLSLIPFKEPGMRVHFYSAWWIAEILTVNVHIKISHKKKTKKKRRVH